MLYSKCSIMAQKIDFIVFFRLTNKFTFLSLYNRYLKILDSSACYWRKSEASRIVSYCLFWNNIRMNYDDICFLFIFLINLYLITAVTLKLHVKMDFVQLALLLVSKIFGFESSYKPKLYFHLLTDNGHFLFWNLSDFVRVNSLLSWSFLSKNLNVNICCPIRKKKKLNRKIWFLFLQNSMIRNISNN